VAEFDDYLADFYTQYDQARGAYANSTSEVSNALTDYYAGDDHAAIRHLITAASKTAESLGLWFYTYTYNYPRYNLIKLIETIDDRLEVLETGGDYELTMFKIIEAYLKAPDVARSGYQLLVDAYQVSMYDKPFDREYHALWIQRFKSWT